MLDVIIQERGSEMKAQNVQPNLVQDLVDFSPRQGEVLDAALDLLVSAGDKLTMAAVTSAASCSKETLYNWFGDRDGLLVAIVQWQAAKVQMPNVDLAQLSKQKIENSLAKFGASLLGVLSGDTSVALNRMAIARSASSGSSLGHIMLQNGRFAMGKQLKPLLEAGADAHILTINDSEEAFAGFFGLLVRDIQIRLLLGDDILLSKNQISLQAQMAARQFLQLYSNS